MKILKLTFENINSLKGKWQIDFEDPAFNSHALFAITGPTGAGKTTILDAICLALYGETPRLNVSATHNELMSIGTAMAASTVIFRANNKIYQVSWSQRRAKQKVDGNLQAVSREISLLEHADDTHGKILEEKASLVNKEIECILGMNKVQFTRSVMLVQGEFAAFLQSDAAERGQILEQITGTHIYAKIGQAAFEKHKEQLNLLKNLQIKLGEVRLLNSEEYDQLIEQISEVTEQKSSLESQIKLVSDHQKTADDYQTLNKEINHYQAKLIEHQEDLTNFEPNIQRLNRAHNAKNLQPLYTVFHEQHLEQLNKKEQLITLNARLNEIHLSHQKHSQVHDQFQENINKLNNDYEILKPKLQAARRLDQHISALYKEQQSLIQTLEKTKQTHSSAQELLKETQASQSALVQDIDSIQQKISRIDSDNINKKLHLCNNHISQYDTLRRAIAHAHQQQLQRIETFNIRLGKLKDKRKTFKAIGEALRSIESQIIAINDKIIDKLNLNKKDIINVDILQKTIENQYAKIKQQTHILHTLDRIYENYEQYTLIQSEISDTSRKMSDLQTEKTNIQTALETLSQKIEQASETHKAVLENYELHKQILHMKAHFDQLKDGDPCPLCGSTEHPFKSQPNHLDGKNAELTKEKLLLCETKLNELNETANQQTTTLHKLQVTLDAHQDHLSLAQNKSKHLHHDLNATWQTIAGEINSDNSTTLPSKGEIDKLIKNSQDNIQHLEETYRLSSGLLHELNQLIAQKDKQAIEKENLKANGLMLRDNTEMLMREIFDAKSHFCDQLLAAFNQLIQAQNTISTPDEFSAIKQHLSEISTWYDIIAHHTQGNVLPNADDFSLSVLKLNEEEFDQVWRTLSKTQHSLESQANQAMALNDDLLEKQTKLIHLDAQINAHAEKIQELTPLIDELNRTLDDKTLEIKTQVTERTALLGDQDPDQTEKHYQDQLTKARADLDSSTKALHDNLTALHAQRATIESLDLSITELTNKLDQSKAAFDDALMASEFGTQDEFLAAMISEDELIELKTAHDAIIDKLNQTKVSLNNYQEKLDKLIMAHPNAKQLNTDDLQAKLTDLQRQLEGINQSIGELNAVKNSELQNRRRHTQILKDIQRQEQENAIWAKLDMLIGSADGKKYRNFVQGLTLDLVLHHANQILAKMNDRYLLTFDADSSRTLEILVTDLHQGDAVRSSKNLSGGESFIISLALALGLSQINSQNVQIESLFLDEGFGTLDETALDLALNTLFELQQSGKSIGIISHVASLKERIDTQIIVEKHAGGYSTLHGAGVKNLS
ncbi:AAA family ATPase [Moraxella catarrhalis]|uniref:Exonuclease SbcC n=1 Tax=Moraxella catarrhalis TaxID=480 RepID=A0A198UJ36_MORCA|nr:AAA family ATPase [Moraxella catarrhalis]OAU95252.1 Exonuclease SbcC [Moraxella catarrhalis]OAU98151.1 Exonuclease SbcC [Moraxella catarrhalis]OAU99828.1 Exonuclease SbcC [Moraxella catarrhalis]